MLLMAWLKQFGHRALEFAQELVDPWFGSEGKYLSRIQGKLEKIAEALSQEMGPVRTRFNRATGWAELYILGGRKVVAQITANGGECTLSEVVVILDRPLTKSLQDLFTSIMPVPVQFKAL